LAGVTTSVQPVAVDVGRGRSVNCVNQLSSYPSPHVILGPVATMIQRGSFSNITVQAAATMHAEIAAGL